MSAKQSELFSVAAPAVINMGTDSGLMWHEIALAFYNADGTPYTGSLPLAGTATMEAVGAFSDLPESGANPLTLATERRWAPFLSGVKSVTVTLVDTVAEAYCIATVTSEPA